MVDPKQALFQARNAKTKEFRKLQAVIPRWVDTDPAAIRQKLRELRLAELRREQAREARQRELDAAGDPTTPSSVLRSLAGHNDSGIMLAAARNRKTPMDAVLSRFKALAATGRQPKRLRVASGQNRTEEMKRLARSHLGASNGTPVVIVLNSNKPPHWSGQGYGWESPGGVEWRGRSAPSWPYFKTYDYRSSTLKIKVGSGWFNDNPGIDL